MLWGSERRGVEGAVFLWRPQSRVGRRFTGPWRIYVPGSGLRRDKVCDIIIWRVSENLVVFFKTLGTGSISTLTELKRVFYVTSERKTTFLRDIRPVKLYNPTGQNLCE